MGFNSRFKGLIDEAQTQCFFRALLKLRLSTSHRLAGFIALVLRSEVSFLLPIHFQTLKVGCCLLGYYTVYDYKVVPTFRKEVSTAFQGY